MSSVSLAEKKEKLQEWIETSNNIVFFGGAGVSTESGIPDFRSTNGLYSLTYDEPPETILSHTYYKNHPEKFFCFHRDKMICLEAKPNQAHMALARLEEAGKVKAVITQNIDGLHQMAGSKKVLELHGSVHRNYCESCHQQYDAQYMLASQGVPRCTRCGNQVKPDVILYEEGLDPGTLQEAISFISKADVLIVGGTSLVVYPAAQLVDYYQGCKLVLINRDATAKDNRADLLIRGSIGEVLGGVYGV